MEPLLSLRDIKKTFREDSAEYPALSGISFDVYPGEILCIMGPSGCGKTTLLRVIAGLETSDYGSLSLPGNPGKSAGSTAMVFQEDALFPWLTVRDNVRYGLSVGQGRSVPDDEAERRVADLLTLVGLDTFSSSYPYQLSGGMKQRAAVARALAVQPKVILMDEPFSALDPFTRRELEDEVIRIRDESTKTSQTVSVLLVTHNPEEAVYLSDRILVLSDRPATVRGMIEVRLPYPRSISDREFITIREHVTGLVKR